MVCEMEKKVAKNSLKNITICSLRILRATICLFILISTAIMMMIYCGFPAGVVLRFFSLRYSRASLSFLFGSWLSLWPFLFEKINKTRVVFCGDKVASEDRVLLIANHRTEVDWMYLWDLALRKGQIGNIKYILKNSLMKLPVFGWAFHLFEFIPVERKWEIDEGNMKRMLSTLSDPRDPLWLALFPEGTDYTEAKCERSRKFAADNGLPVLNNVLLPKTKGFLSCLQELRSSLNAVYDVTIGYKTHCPSFLDNVYGTEPSEVHIHIRRYSLDQIPTNENEISEWLMETFEFKDQILGKFYAKGHFPHEGTETEFSTKKYIGKCFGVIIFATICTYLSVFSSIWFKIYVSLVSAYFTSATHFGLRPAPLVEFTKKILYSPKITI